MTVAIPEVAAAAESATAAAVPSAAPAAGTAASRARAARPLPTGGRGRPKTSRRQGSPGGGRRFTSAQPAGGGGRHRGRAKGPDLQETGKRLSKAIPRDKVPRGNYQAAILAEFVLAVVLTATAPIVTKKPQTGISPYAGRDMIQLLALTMVYFLLAMISAAGGQTARACAWLGGLVLLGVGLGQAAHIAKELDLFGATVDKLTPALHHPPAKGQ